MQNFYPRSPCGERLGVFVVGLAVSRISIHALLAESDLATWQSYHVRGNFYPRSPCGERQAPPCYNLMIHQNFYPRSPCGERLNLTFHQRGCIIFLSTLSLRRATLARCGVGFGHLISIHALLAESDARNTSIAGRITAFLSTLSLRRATYIIRYPVNLHTISIHALLAESDPPKDCACPPIEISIHALLAESDGKVRVVEPGFENISIHALLAESDLLNSSWISSIRNFYPRSPCGERRKPRRLKSRR